MLVTIWDSKATAVIDSVGAQLITYKDADQKEYIWQRDPKFWEKSSPILFPIVGNLRNDETIIEGKPYHLTKHGFCREKDFSVVSHTSCSALFQLTDSEETKAVYPYSFRLSLEYQLKDGVLTIHYQVDNRDDRTIYYCIGAHPGFNCPLEDGSAFEDYQLVFEQEETASSIVYDLEKLQFDPNVRKPLLNHCRVLPLSRELFKDDAIFFDSLKSKRVSILHKQTGRGVEVGFPDFATVAFWTPYPADAPFLCIEPWNASAVLAGEDDIYSHKQNIQVLGVESSKSYYLTIRPAAMS